MNLRRIANLWRKKSVGSEPPGSATPQPSPSASQEQHEAWQRYLATFGSSQAALHYVEGLLDARRPPAAEVASPSSLDADRLCAGIGTPPSPLLRPRSASASPATRDAVHARRQEREELMDALDLCLLAVPDGEARAHWRGLLRRLAAALLETERAMHAEVRRRGAREAGREQQTPVNTSPTTTPRRISLPTPLATVGLRRAEEQLTVIGGLTTWVTLRALLQKWLHGDAGTVNAHDTKGYTGDGEEVVVKVPWAEVVAELVQMLGAIPRRVVIVLVSLWILRDTGREIFYCVLQRPYGAGEEGESNTLDRRKTLSNNNDPPVQSTASTSTSLFTPGKGSEGSKASEGVVPLFSTPHTMDTTIASATSATSTHVNSHSTAATAAVPAPVGGAAGAGVGVGGTGSGSGGDGIASSSAVAEQVPVVDDLSEQLEGLYEKSVIATWAAYLEESSDNLFDWDESKSVDEGNSTLDRCYHAVLYAVLSPYWSEDRRQRVFHSLWEDRTEKYDTMTFPTSPPQAVLDEMFGADTPVTEVERSSVCEELLPLLLPLTWAAALHARVEQCLALGLCTMEAERLALAEREAVATAVAAVAHPSGVFIPRQQALESLVLARIAARRGPDALRSAQKHFARAKKEWAAGRQGLHDAVGYLESMSLLTRAQAACRIDNSIVETAQFALPQAALCEQLLGQLVPPFSLNHSGNGSRNGNENNNHNIIGSSADVNHRVNGNGNVNGVYALLRYADIRRRILLCRCVILRESWMAYHRMMNVTLARKFFEDYMGQLKRVRRSRRTMAAYAALRDRGEQLEQDRSYGSAVLVYKQALECVKTLSVPPQPCGTNQDAATTAVNLLASTSSSTTSNITPAPASISTSTSANVAAVTATTTNTNTKTTATTATTAVSAGLMGTTCPLGSSSVMASMISTHPSTVEELGRSPIRTPEPTKGVDRGLEQIRFEAESERSLALAFVLQADHEVNVRQRRQQLSNAVNSAYAAQNALHRCTLRARTSNGGTPLDVASSLVAAAKALLRLGQPKKAALLLEPLIEDKANSASVRPSHWTDAMKWLPTEHHGLQEEAFEKVQPGLTAAEFAQRVETLQVKIATYDVHTQCLSLFDGERSCREAARARSFAQEVQLWSQKILIEVRDQLQLALPRSSNKHSTRKESEDFRTDLSQSPSQQQQQQQQQLLLSPSSSPALSPWCDCSTAQLLRQCLREACELERALNMTCGNALASLGKWEDALQEYSTALATYADSSVGEDTSFETPAELERARTEARMGETLVLAKLAEVYTALEKPRTAIHYFNQVLEYAADVGEALLEYKTRVRLARLYTATGAIEEAGEQWAKVSALAKEYEDPEVGRETTRNIVAAQRAAGLYADALKTAEELEQLASAAEGVGAASDRRFALETIADAQLQLGQYKKCIIALDEREKVQDKDGQWSGYILSIRARALLGDDATHEAIKVLTTWATEARQRGSWNEVGRANAALAHAYATIGQVFKAKRHHKIVLTALSEVGEMSKESRQAILESARWLVHYFYLNDEDVQLEIPEPPTSVSAASSTSNSNSNTGNSGNSGNSMTGVGSGASDKSTGRPNSKTASPLHRAGVALDDYEVSNDSGDLSVLMRKEEQRLSRGRGPNAGVTTSSTSGSNDGSEKGDDNGEIFVDRSLKNNSLFDLDLAAILDEGPGGNERRPRRHSQGESVAVGKSTQQLGSPERSTQQQQQPAKPTSTLANVSLCKRPATLAGESPNFLQERSQQPPSDAGSDSSHHCSPRRERTTVRTLCYHRTLETIEAAVQFSMMSSTMRQRLIPRNPADAVDLALLAFPRCTFLFYFAEFATQLSVIVRPAGRCFFIKRSVQAYTLTEFHSKVPPPQPQHHQPPQHSQTQPSQPHLPLSSPVMESDISVPETRFSALASSLSSIRRKSRAASTESSLAVAATAAAAAAMTGMTATTTSTTRRASSSVATTSLAAVLSPTSPLDATWSAVDEELRTSLRDLHADLWVPVRDSLRFAGCDVSEADGVVVVADPVLLHVPFPALLDDTEEDGVPLGQQATLVVTPTVAHFMHTMRRRSGASLLDDKGVSERFAFLPERPSDRPSRRFSVESGHPNSNSSSHPYTDGGAGHDGRDVAGWLSAGASRWTVYHGCTRKEMTGAFASPHSRALLVLCDPVGHLFKVADGMVRLTDITRGATALPHALDLVVVTNERLNAPSADEPGVAARLCLDHGCRRVLRLDLPHGMGITRDHTELLRLYMEKLALVWGWRMDFPFALALRMAQEEARVGGMRVAVWSALTLVGAA